MLKPKKVSRALVLGNKKLLDQAVETLHDLSCVHIEDFTEETDFLSIGKPADVASEASNKLIKLRSLSNFLKVKPKYPDNLLNEESLLNEFDAKLDENHGCDVADDAVRVFGRRAFWLQHQFGQRLR